MLDRVERLRGAGAGAERERGERDGGSDAATDRMNRPNGMEWSCSLSLHFGVWRTTTLVPTGTRSNRSITSGLTSRKQPDDTDWPMVWGWLVP